MTPNHIMMPSTCSNNTPKSIVILKNKKSCHLKKEPMSLENQSRSTPPETAKQIARSVKMNNNEPRNCGRKPCRFGTA